MGKSPGHAPILSLSRSSATYNRYRHLAIEGANPPPSEAQIADIEALLEARLPAAFKEYLAVASGGYMEYVTGGGRMESLSFGGLFSAEAGTFCDETFVGELRSEREYTQIPKGVLPFARDGGGSIVYLDLTDEGKGRVLAFVKGLPAWAGKRTESDFIELASSFDEYVGKLRIDRDMVIDNLERYASELSHIAATQEWLDIGMPDWRSDSALAGAVEAATRRIS